MKSNKIILGGGVIALLAKYILGDDWTIIPFGRSRFYSFMPALADNFIINDPKITDLIENLGGKPRYPYQIRYSIQGELMPFSISICDAWLDKVFKGNPPPHATAYYKSRQNFFVYDLRVNKLYQDLQSRYRVELTDRSKIGDVTEIGDHFIRIGNTKHDFEQCVSTIPLHALLPLCNMNGVSLERSPMWMFHIQTNDLDFEGSNQVFVVDQAMDFYKVARIREDRYLFYCNREISQPGPYFMNFMPKGFDIIDGTMIPDAIIMDNKPKVDLGRLGITCVGSYAEWDWCADVGSCIMSLLRYREPAST